MISNLIKRALPLAAILLLATPAFATSFVVPPDEILFDRADAVVSGFVITAWEQVSYGGWPERVAEVQVTESFKGPHETGSVIRIHSPGGDVPGQSWKVHAAPRWRGGSEVILFLFESQPGRWAMVDLAIGKFDVRRDVTGRSVAVRQDDDIDGVDLNGQPMQSSRRGAPEFVRYLKQRAQGRRPAPSYAVPPAPLALEDAPMDEVSGILAATAATPISYTMEMGGGGGARWSQFPSQIPWRHYNAAAASGSTAAMSAAVNAWNTDGGSNVNYALVGASPGVPNGLFGNGGAGDNENSIRWEIDLPDIPDYSCSGGGTLGLGGLTLAGSPILDFGGSSFYTALEGDVDMNRGVACANQDIKNTALAHELGHTLGFRHSDKTRNNGVACAAPLACSSSAVMRSVLLSGINAALQPWDVDAVRAVYPGASPEPPPPPPPPTGSGIKGDFNGDARADLIWRNMSTGQNSFWFLDGTRVAGGGAFNAVSDVNWTIGGTGDFNGDGFSDILWRHAPSGTNTVWLMNGAGYSSQVALPSLADSSWQAKGVGDLDGDGHVDIVWRNSVTGSNAVWFMNRTGLARDAQLPAVTDLTWQIAGSGDVNRDGRSDVVLWNSVTGSVVVWFMNGSTRVSQWFVGGVADLQWRVGAVGDFNADGYADIIWKNSSGGAAFWALNGSQVLGGGFIGAVPAPWEMAGAR